MSGKRAKKRFTRLRRLCVRQRGEGLLCRRRFRRSRFRIKYLRAKEVINFFHFSFHGVVFLLFNASSNTATTESPATLARVYKRVCDSMTAANVYGRYSRVTRKRTNTISRDPNSIVGGLRTGVTLEIGERRECTPFGPKFF